jgi:hypothetical protein
MGEDELGVDAAEELVVELGFGQGEFESLLLVLEVGHFGAQI